MSLDRARFDQAAKLRPDDPLGAAVALDILERRYPGKFGPDDQKRIVDATITANRFEHLSIDDRVRFFANNLLLGQDPAALIDQAGQLPASPKGKSKGFSALSERERATVLELLGTAGSGVAMTDGAKQTLASYLHSLGKGGLADKV